MCWGTIGYCVGIEGLSTDAGLESLLAADGGGSFISVLGTVAAGYSELVKQAGDNIQALIGLAGLSFAVMKWWRYREKVLFRRLDEYLDREQSRLRHARAELFETVLRPGAGRMVEAPVLALPALRRALRAWGWMPGLSFVNSNGAAANRLTTAAVHLQEQRVLRERQHLQLDQTIAAAQLLRGAIEGARAARTEDPNEKKFAVQNAIAHFDDALRLPGNEDDLDARELKLYQLIFIQQLDAADAVVEDLEQNVRALPPSRERASRLSRALKYKCFIERSRNRPGNVNSLCNDALRELAAYIPLTGHELLDQAELHELQAWARVLLGFSAAAHMSLENALRCYRELAGSQSRSSFSGRLGYWFRTWTDRRNAGDGLYCAAKAGEARVLDAAGPHAVIIKPKAVSG